MRWDKRTLPGSPYSADGTGTGMLVAQYTDKYVQITAGNMVVTVQGTIDGTNWAAIGAIGPTASGFVSVPQSVEQIRIVVSAFAAGTSSAVLGFREGRSQ